MPVLFVTGATGFVGRALTRRIAARDDVTATGLVRTVPSADSTPKHVHFAHGDLLDEGDWAVALDGIDTIVHLAAATGRISADRIHRVNVDGTERLLEHARRAGVRRMLFVSSIAAKFADAPHYHYAASKRAAESLVLESGLRTLIVRPTIVLGTGSPIGQRLRTLALAPVIPVFGDGHTRIQPIHVDDLAAILLDLALSAEFDGRTVEVGGPDVIEIESFLRRVRAAVRGDEPGALHVPVPPLRALLAGIERISIHLVPFTAGQLATFTNDGVVAADNAYHGPIECEHDVKSMVAETAGDG